MKISKFLFLCLTGVANLGTSYVSASDSSSTCDIDVVSHACNNCADRGGVIARPLTPKSAEIAELKIRLVAAQAAVVNFDALASGAEERALVAEEARAYLSEEVKRCRAHQCSNGREVAALRTELKKQSELATAKHFRDLVLTAELSIKNISAGTYPVGVVRIWREERGVDSGC